MPDTLYALAVLACPVAMGAMMWFMMRGHGPKRSASTDADELTRLRAEVDQLHAAQDARGQTPPVDRAVRPR